MKLSALLLRSVSLGVAALACSAQTSPSSSQLQGILDRTTQANCPVVLASAWLAPRLQLLKSGDASGGNGLDLEFRNASGKEIRSIELSATILVKKSIYDLGYLPPVHLHLTAYGTQNIDSAFAELRRLSLPEEMHPALVDGVRLEQVTFEDGSVWSPENDQFCGLKPDPMRSIAR
ncbi:MAG: hypothetical protein JOY95_14860 [Silvibacterium sp.]|nr:hypothetical protein [Silvibacterium sp.]